MDDTTREQAIRELDELRAQMRSTGPRDSSDDITLIEHVDELQAIVADDRNPGMASKAAQRLEQRLLAWEAEHPQIVALASRVARALESSGL